MEIKNYEVILNEKNATCGFVVNLNYYKIEQILQKNLKYEVFRDEKKVRVFSEDNDELWFLNLTDQLIYYAYKTINLTLLGGTDEGKGKIKIFSEAVLV